ncbi:hypothetical protein O0L34_g11072 [Tuta absoluta]|nr:hypothetical protein O0L34_g11072 [Tuta absoluta]
MSLTPPHWAPWRPTRTPTPPRPPPTPCCSLQSPALFVSNVPHTAPLGSLVAPHAHPDTAAPTTNPVLLATVTGAICLVVTVPASLYELLRSLEARLSRVIKSVGRVAHSVWRSFNTDIKTEPAEGFVDGDLVEAFLDLDRDTQHHAIQGIQMDDGGGMMRDATVDDIVKIVEDLTRIH